MPPRSQRPLVRRRAHVKVAGHWTYHCSKKARFLLDRACDLEPLYGIEP